jgi:anhydro-N-acetylmuramic acid kinase
MRVLGMISGTSHDGIDIAIVNFATSADGALGGQIEYSTSVPYDADLRGRLIAALPPAAIGFDVAAELDTQIGQAFAAAAAEAIVAHAALPGAEAVDAICTHGQTVFHWVSGATALGTLQIGQPAWIAEATGLPVISDVRAADIAAGGQGAPLVPLLDRMLLEPFRSDGLRSGALNLGGIANVTVCAPGIPPVAWDIGPANALIDAVVTASESTPDNFDRDGAIAASGTVNAELLSDLLAEPYYALPSPKSSGKELFHSRYIDDALRRVGVSPSFPDLVATLTELTAVTVSNAIRDAKIDTVFASGGGVRNPVLMNRISELLPGATVGVSDELGVASDDKEAVAFALIGWATLHGLPGNVPSCTGASGDRVLGRVSPGPTAVLSLPTPLTEWPSSLTLSGANSRAVS